MEVISWLVCYSPICIDSINWYEIKEGVSGGVGARNLTSALTVGRYELSGFILEILVETQLSDTFKKILKQYLEM